MHCCAAVEDMRRSEVSIARCGSSSCATHPCFRIDPPELPAPFSCLLSTAAPAGENCRDLNLASTPTIVLIASSSLPDSVPNLLQSLPHSLPPGTSADRHGKQKDGCEC
jgi:hypothetical protein